MSDPRFGSVDASLVISVLEDGEVVVRAADLYRVRVGAEGSEVLAELMSREEAEAMVEAFNECNPEDPAEAISYAELASCGAA